MARTKRPSMYDLEAIVASESHPDATPYEIKRHRLTGDLSCNCPAWIFHKGPSKTCKHLDGFRSGAGHAAPIAIAHAMLDAVEKRRARGTSERMSVVITHPKDAAVSPCRAIILPD